MILFFLRRRQQPRLKRTATFLPYTTLFRSSCTCSAGSARRIPARSRRCCPDRSAFTTCPPTHPAPSTTSRRSLSGPSAPTTRPTSPSPCRLEEHTSELQTLMRISYAVFCLKIKTQQHLHSFNTISH